MNWIRWLALVEAIIGFILLVIDIWLFKYFWGFGLISIIGLMLLSSFFIWGDRWCVIGFGRTGFVSVFLRWVLPIVIVCCLGYIVGFAFNLVPSITLRMIFSEFGFYVFWAFVQQYIFNGFMTRRLEYFWGNERKVFVVVSSAAIYSLVHWPNLPLLSICFVFGLFTASLYLKYRNLYATSIIHAFAGATFFLFRFNMAIGPFYVE